MLHTLTCTLGARRVPVRQIGDGPRCALLLHGFPDTPLSLAPLQRQLAHAGLRTYAPLMRGYAPDALDPDGDYSHAALAADVPALLDALDLNRVDLLIGHDWGAIAAAAAARLAPARVDVLILAAVPPLRLFLRNLPRHPAQLLRSWYIALFQLRGVAERCVAARDFALLTRLWRAWSPDLTPGEPLEAVRQAFAHPAVLRAALTYYRDLLSPRVILAQRRLALAPIERPTLMLAGARDGCIAPELFDDPAPAFRAPWALEVLPDAGHFMLLEDPAGCAARILRFYEAQRASA